MADVINYGDCVEMRDLAENIPHWADDEPFWEEDELPWGEDRLLVEEHTLLFQEGGPLWKADIPLEEEDGSLVEEDGLLLEEDGPLLDEDGSLLEEDGSLLEEDGSLLEENGPLLEEDGPLLKDHRPFLNKNKPLLLPGCNSLSEIRHLQNESSTDLYCTSCLHYRGSRNHLPYPLMVLKLTTKSNITGELGHMEDTVARQLVAKQTTEIKIPRNPGLTEDKHCWTVNSASGVTSAIRRLKRHQPQTLYIDIPNEVPTPVLMQLCRVINNKFTGILYLKLWHSFFQYVDCSDIIKVLAKSRLVDDCCLRSSQNQG